MQKERRNEQALIGPKTDIYANVSQSNSLFYTKYTRCSSFSPENRDDLSCDPNSKITWPTFSQQAQISARCLKPQSLRIVLPAGAANFKFPLRTTSAWQSCDDMPTWPSGICHFTFGNYCQVCNGSRLPPAAMLSKIGLENHVGRPPVC